MTRRRIFKAGTIECGERIIPCTVRSLSSADATLDVASPLWLPSRFTLFIASESLRKTCHIIWRKEEQIAILFD